MFIIYSPQSTSLSIIHKKALYFFLVLSTVNPQKKYKTNTIQSIGIMFYREDGDVDLHVVIPFVLILSANYCTKSRQIFLTMIQIQCSNAAAHFFK